MKSNLNPSTPADVASLASGLKAGIADSVERLSTWAEGITANADALPPLDAAYHQSELTLQEALGGMLRSLLNLGN